MKSALISLLLALIAYELKAWFPRLLIRLITLAAYRLPRRERMRFREEWHAHIDETPGAIVKLMHCAGFMIASGRMFPRWRRAVNYRRRVALGWFATRMVTRMADLLIVSGALTMLLPLFAIVSAVSARKGPIFTRQNYVGRKGTLFQAYRFRTLSEGGWGYFLQATSINELPLLINVLQGDMSLVGPRPGAGNWPHMKPGITGLLLVTTEANFSRQGPPKYFRPTVKTYFRTLFLTTTYLFRHHLHR